MRDLFRPTTAEINLGAIERNYRTVRGLLRPSTKFLAVVKADAYGHGAVPVARRLCASGADWLGVAQVEEGAQLRREGISCPILIMQGLQPAEAGAAVDLGLTALVFQKSVVDALAAHGRKAGKKIPVHVKVDTGMTRLGVLPEDLAGFLDYVMGQDGIQFEGIGSHLASAENPEDSATVRQKQLFAQATEVGTRKARGPLLRHLANSAATILDPGSHYDMVRIGITLYGEHPAPRTQPRVNLEPALTWRTFVSQIKTVPAGTGVSYGGTFRTSRESRIGVLPVGYADGYPRALSNNAEVAVGGSKCPLVGTVCMDLVMVDLTAVPGVKEGDEALLLGGVGDARISAGELARRCGTISYEILCGIGKRVPRVYLE